MSRQRRVGGSAWAGVSGSFIGLSKSNATAKSGVRLGNPRKKKATVVKIDLATLPKNDDLQQAAKRVLAVQSDLEKTKTRMKELENQLSKAMEQFTYAKNLAMPQKLSRKVAKNKSNIVKV